MTDVPANGGTARAALMRIERDVDLMGGKLDDFIKAHGLKHEDEQSAFQAHLLATAPLIERFGQTTADAPLIEARVAVIEEWKHELFGAMRLIRFAFGASIISAVTAIVALISLLTRGGTP